MARNIRITLQGELVELKDIFTELQQAEFFNYTKKGSTFMFEAVDGEDLTTTHIKKLVSHHVEVSYDYNIGDMNVALELDCIRKALDNAEILELEAA